MATPPVIFLREVELRLLRCTFPSDPNNLPSTSQPPEGGDDTRRLVEPLIAAVERGDYAAALASPAARAAFLFAEGWGFEDSTSSAAGFYEEVARSAAAFLGGGVDGTEVEARCALVFCVAVAALLAFTQLNITGPVGKFPSFPLHIGSLKQEQEYDGSVGKEWDAWASGQLASVGSHVHGKFSLLQYIVYADILFNNLKDFSFNGNTSCFPGLHSISWWLCRLSTLHQRILDELSSSLFDQLLEYKNATLHLFGNVDTVSSYWGSLLWKGECSKIASAACLEAGIAEHKYGRVDISRSHIASAETACGLHLSVTGALGFRTIHQVNATSQRVLIATTEQLETSETELPEFQQDHCGVDVLATNGSSSCESDNSSDILRTPKLLQNGNIGDANRKASETRGNLRLTDIQQAVVLAQCLHLSRSSRDDELSKWDMAPYIECIDSQQRSHYVVKSMCDVLRIRWEFDRNRTKERALLMMQNLVENVVKELPVASERIQMAYGLYLPTISALRKEYGEQLVSCGLVGEALKIFTDLELWDNLIFCYQLLGKGPEAVSLINARLAVTPNDPRLWCSLGDATNNDDHYRKALEASNQKSARAMRSLARSAYNRNDFHTSKFFWESALAINSLHHDGWFALGTAAWKDKDFDKAVEAFTHAVQVDPENGEAWNNMACLHMLRGKSQAAFNAFKEAVKYKRNSWEVWENYSKVAFDIGNFEQTLEAVKMVQNLSSNKRLDVILLGKVMSFLEEQPSQSTSDSFDAKENGSVPNPSLKNGHVESKLSYQFNRLLDAIGNILQQAVRAVPNEDIWGLFARFNKIKGNLTICSEALLKQIRSLQGSGVWRDEDKFKRFASASLKLCEVYMETASNSGSRRELLSAEMHLKSSLKQASDFSGTTEFKALEECLSNVKHRLGST